MSPKNPARPYRKISIRRNDRLPESRMLLRDKRTVLVKISRPREVTLEDVRRCFSYNLVNYAGYVLPILQTLMGHGTIRVIMRYLRSIDAFPVLE